jgi:23S rRNA (uracil1939-C5)-methyltransferase
MQQVRIEKLVHGGQALATLPDGKKIFLWNALPGELVEPRITKDKRGHTEGIVEEIIEASPDRIAPLDDAYLSTSPWQIMSWEFENAQKQAILVETLQREHVKYDASIPLHHDENQLHYRNKMEYSFWGDEDGLHLALFNRGSHGKRIITGSSLAHPEIDDVANKICTVLNKAGIRGSQLKTVVLRASQAGDVVAALFVKDEKFPKLSELFGLCKGITVCFSNPKSPASVLTHELYSDGDTTLADLVLCTNITYDVNSFFQVNLPIFETAAEQIREAIKTSDSKVDFYSGVGTIGLPAEANTLVELDPRNIKMAKHNAKGRHIKIVQASAETALEYIPSEGALIVDPPRAGLHQKVIERIRDARPETIAYLSCNPITQARDLALLQDIYTIQSIEGYNFFPRTPHIESLAILACNS